MERSLSAKLPTSKRIFLSYGRDEYTPFVLRLKKDLADAGHEVWFDAERLEVGKDWEQYIEEGLAWASETSHGLFVLMMTPHSVRRPDGFCLNELARAIQLGLKVIPIMLVLCEPPLSICRIQWLDMQDCVPVEKNESNYAVKMGMLLGSISQDRPGFEGDQSRLSGILKPLSFDAEIKHSLDNFMGRSWILDEIEKWLRDSNAQRVFWITGSPGMGKTSISAWLCMHLREVSAYHFCRNENVQKTDPRRCIMSLAYQLSTQMPVYEEQLKRLNPADLQDLNSQALFDVLIAQPLSGHFLEHEGYTVILIDGLDEATVGGKNELARIIASEFECTPSWLRFIVTSRPDPEVSSQMQAFKPFPLEAGDIRNEIDICKYLAKGIDKSVPPDVIKKVAEKCNGLFIYAEFVLKELQYGRLSLDHLEDFPQGLGGIYLRFFERQFPDNRIWESRVLPALELIAAAQEPLSMKTIMAILKWNIHEERELRRSLGSLFIFDSGIVQPFHLSVMEWLTDENKGDKYFVSVAEGHRVMGTHLLEVYRKGKLSWNNSLVRYLPLHLCLADRGDDLEKVLHDMDFISFEWARDQFNVMRWWALAEDRMSLRMTDVFRSMIDDPGHYRNEQLGVPASMLKSAFYLPEALKIYEYLVEYYRDMGRPDDLRENLSNMASILIDMSDYDRAMPLLEELEQMCRKAGRMDQLQSSLLARAEILWRKNDFDTALSLLREQERICRETGNNEGLGASLISQSTILRVKGDLKQAMALLKEQERICRSIGNLLGVTTSLLNQGFILKATGDLDTAIMLFNEVEGLARKTNNQQYLITSINSLASVYGWRGELDRSMEIVEKVEKLCKELKYNWGFWDCLHNRAFILIKKGDLDGASLVIEESLSLCRNMDNPFGTQSALVQKAHILLIRGDLDGALSLFKESERICREIGHKRDLAVSLSSQAVVLRMKGDLNGAMALHDESEKMLREIGYKYGLQECLGNKAMTLYAKGNIDGALELLEEQKKICTDMGLKPDLKQCIDNQALVLAAISGEQAQELEKKRSRC